VSSDSPVPGGGAVSAVAGSFAAGLVAMVASLSIGRPKYAAYEATLTDARAHAERAKDVFLELADRDAAAYAAFAAALRLPRDTEDQQAERRTTMREAARTAAAVPLEILHASLGMAIHVEAIAGRSNLNASSDVNVAALLVDAAARGAAANVLVNLPSVEDEEFAANATDQVMRHLATIAELTAQAHERVGSGRLREPEPS
jgi:formiminotetrahydrofolate cyclodeaminase